VQVQALSAQSGAGAKLDWLNFLKLDILFSPEMFYNRLNLKKKRGFEHEV